MPFKNIGYILERVQCRIKKHLCHKTSVEDHENDAQPF